MARTVTTKWEEAAYAQETGETELALLEIDHADISTERLVNNMTDVTSNGNTYTAYPFKTRLPEEGDRVGKAQIQLDNSDRRLVSTLRGLSGSATATLKVILASAPDDIVLELGPLQLETAEITLQQISLTLGPEPIMLRPFPPDQYIPSTFPAMF